MPMGVASWGHPVLIGPLSHTTSQLSAPPARNACLSLGLDPSRFARGEVGRVLWLAACNPSSQPVRKGRGGVSPNPQLLP